MAREHYREALDELRTDVQSLADRVLDQLDRGLEALERKDEALARSVIEGDEAVNDRYLDLEADCIDIFALQQPVASDLRFVAATFKILTDLERIGDLATNFARYALSAEQDRPGEVDVYRIGTAARELVADAVEAYVAGDAAACRAVADRDDEIDALCQSASERVVRDLIERDAGEWDGWSVERLLDDISRVLLTIRDIERVGDHAVNVAARSLYMIDNDPELVY